MDEHPESALHYGHVGRATYHTDTRSWSFTRSFKAPSTISNTGLTRTTVPSPLASIQRQHFTEHLPSAGHDLIPKVLPDLAADWSSLRDDTASRALVNTLRRYDPQVSTLLALGYAEAASGEGRRTSPSPLAAAVTGECGNVIRFQVLDEDTVKVDDGPELHVPSIAGGHFTEWSRRGAPILQICFARSLEERPHWMAARLQDVTVIFRPCLYRRETVPMYVHDEDDIAALGSPRRNSPLDANPVVEIATLQTGGVPHADVTFNPWYNQQFGIIDTEGNWSIWEIISQSRKRKSKYAPKFLKSGSMPWMDHSQDPNGPQHDGWASIEWVGDVSTVLVSDRRCAMICPIFGEENSSTPVELGLSVKSEWVLQVQRSVQNTSQFFILTTTRLLWYDMAMAQPNTRGQMSALFPRLSWRHFRDPEDTTLQITDLLMEDGLHLVIYSRLSSLVQAYQLPVTTDDEETGVNDVPDCVMLDIPSTLEVSALGEISHTPYSTFLFRQVESALANKAATDASTDKTLVKLFWSDSSFAVHETLFKGPDAKKDEEDDFAEEKIQSHILPLRKTPAHLPTNKKKKSGEDDFIVDDWDETAFAPPRAGIQQDLQFGHGDAPAKNRWTLDMTSLYEIVVKNLLAGVNPSDSEVHPPRPTLDQLTDELSNNTLETLAEWNATQTMLELSRGRPQLNDIDEGAEAFAQLLSTILNRQDLEAQRRFQIMPLHFSKHFHGVPNIPQGLPLGLDYLNTYEQLVTDWVTSLPHGSSGIPGQTRVLKEKMIREITLELCLARIIRISNPASHIKNSQSKAATQSSQPVIKPPKSSQGTAISMLSSQLQPASSTSSQTLPTNKAETGPGPGPGPALNPTPKQTDTQEGQVYNTLAAYTTFREPRRQPRNVAMLLSHWKPGTDPSTYEWTKTSQMLENEESERVSGSQTRPSRSKRSRSRSAAAEPTGSGIGSGSGTGISTGLPPTPVAPIIRASQPQPSWNMGGFASSQPLASSQPTVDDVAMTQVERGPFGMREKKKGKKKRRAAGF